MAVRDDRSDVKQTTTGFQVHWWCNPSPLLKANSYPSDWGVFSWKSEESKKDNKEHTLVVFCFRRVSWNWVESGRFYEDSLNLPIPHYFVIGFLYEETEETFCLTIAVHLGSAGEGWSSIRGLWGLRNRLIEDNLKQVTASKHKPKVGQRRWRNSVGWFYFIL